MSSGVNEVRTRPAEGNSGPAPDRPPMHLQDYWAVVFKHRRLVAFCVAGTLLIALAVSILSTPTYRATVVLNVEREKGSVAEIGNAPQSSYDPEFIPTQTRLMTSREVAERVVSKLGLMSNGELNPVRKGWFRAGGERPGKIPLTRVAAALQKSTEVRPVRGTNLVELSFVARGPAFAAQVANALAESYIDWNLESKFEVVGQASRFLSTQVEQLKSEIDQKEGQLQTYGRQKDIISTDPKNNGTLQNLESLNREYAEAVSDRVSKEAHYHEVQTARPDTIADTLSNGVVTQLRNDISKLEREYADKLNLYRPEWPGMIQLKSQIDKGKQNLNTVVQETVSKARDVARGDYLTALRREESLKGVLQGQKSEALNLKSNEIEYTNLRVEVDTKRALMDTLLKRQAETELSSRLRGERLSNIRVVDKAIPPEARFRPSYSLNGLLGLFMGTVLGIGLAFLFEYLDRSLSTSEQVESTLRLPSLGIIPSASAAPGKTYGLPAAKRGTLTAADRTSIELLPHSNPRSFIGEAYRAFRAALLLSHAGGIRSIVITSSLTGEGKSTTACNLAVVLAQLGKHVLLVDADLHKPRLHEIFRVSNRAGLVSILAEDAKPTDTIIKTAVDGLFLLPSGPHSPNPSSLLASDLMTKLASYATEHFDYLIIDSPPVSAVADALILGQFADGVVLCVKGAKTPRELVLQARDRLLRSNVRILGVLINNLDQSATGYGYGYGKEYGSDVYGAAPPVKVAGGKA